MRLSFLALACAVAAPASAAPGSVRLTRGPKAENALRRFVEESPRLKSRLDDAARREEFFLAESRESDLRDAVSDFSGDALRRGLESSQGSRRKALLSALPGMAPASEPACRTVVDCAVPDLALDVPDARRLSDSVRRLVRPWMVLQQARGADIELSPLEGPGDAALALRLRGLEDQPLVLNVSPRLLGGFSVWFDRPFVLAALYDRERSSLLPPARRPL